MGANDDLPVPSYPAHRREFCTNLLFFTIGKPLTAERRCRSRWLGVRPRTCYSEIVRPKFRDETIVPAQALHYHFRGKIPGAHLLRCR